MGASASKKQQQLQVKEAQAKPYEAVRRGCISMASMEAIMKLSTKEIEQEFDEIYQHSSHILHSLTANRPCQNLAENISECLRTNSDEMCNCFGVMDQYRSCVQEQKADKLNERYKDHKKIK